MSLLFWGSLQLRELDDTESSRLEPSHDRTRDEGTGSESTRVELEPHWGPFFLFRGTLRVGPEERRKEWTKYVDLGEGSKCRLFGRGQWTLKEK